MFSRNRRILMASLALVVACLTSGCTPSERALFGAWVKAQSAPVPVSDSRCPPGPVKDEIDRIFNVSAPWAESIAWRESNCRPEVRNASGSAGVMQLLGHDDLLAEWCPKQNPSVSWADYRCNIGASWLLYSAQGIAPWRL